MCGRKAFARVIYFEFGDKIMFRLKSVGSRAPPQLRFMAQTRSPSFSRSSICSLSLRNWSTRPSCSTSIHLLSYWISKSTDTWMRVFGLSAYWSASSLLLPLIAVHRFIKKCSGIQQQQLSIGSSDSSSSNWHSQALSALSALMTLSFWSCCRRNL